MFDAEKNKRLKELADLIDSEQDAERFSELVAELNDLLDEAKIPGSPARAASR